MVFTPPQHIGNFFAGVQAELVAGSHERPTRWPQRAQPWAIQGFLPVRFSAFAVSLLLQSRWLAGSVACQQLFGTVRDFECIHERNRVHECFRPLRLLTTASGSCQSTFAIMSPCWASFFVIRGHPKSFCKQFGKYLEASGARWRALCGYLGLHVKACRFQLGVW